MSPDRPTAARGLVGMVSASWSDLRWRRRRFAVLTAGTSLVFCVTLITAGVGRGFDTEARRTVSQQGADYWYVAPRSLGPYFGAAGLRPAEVGRVETAVRPARSSPVLFSPATVTRPGGLELVGLFGAVPGEPGFTRVDQGRRPTAPGEAVISTSLTGYRVGSTVNVDGRDVRVVGEVRQSTSLGGHPNIYMSVTDVQNLCCGGLPVVWGVAVQTRSAPPVPGLRIMSAGGAEANLVVPAAKAKQGIVFLSVLLWIVATAIIGAGIYLSALERIRDFAVFKASGVRTADLVAGLVLQAVVLAWLAAALGAVCAVVIGPSFPLTVDLAGRDIETLLGVSLVIGLVASLFGVRRATGVDPSHAFGLA